MEQSLCEASERNEGIYANLFIFIFHYVDQNKYKNLKIKLLNFEYSNV